MMTQSLKNGRRVLLPAMATVAVLITGCSPSEPAPPSQPEEPPAQADKAAADQAAIDRQFTQLDAELAQLQDRLSQLAPEAQQKAEMILNDLRAKRDELMKDYNSGQMQEMLTEAKSALDEWSAAAASAIQQAGTNLQSDATLQNLQQRASDAWEKAKQDVQSQMQTPPPAETTPPASPAPPATN